MGPESFFVSKAPNEAPEKGSRLSAAKALAFGASKSPRALKALHAQVPQGPQKYPEKPLIKGTGLRPGKIRNVFTGLHGLLRQMGHLISGKSS